MNLRPSRALSVAATLLVLAAVGCTDPTVAPKSTVSDAQIWTVQTSYAQFMAKLYGGLILTGQQGPAGNGDIGGIDEGFSEYLRLFWYMQEVPSDEALTRYLELTEMSRRDVEVSLELFGHEQTYAPILRLQHTMEEHA